VEKARFVPLNQRSKQNMKLHSQWNPLALKRIALQF
jgi:hypothetical protein